MLFRSILFTVLTALLILQGGAARANVLNVDKEISSLEKAVNKAEDGDIIFLEPGTYYGDIKINKNLSIIGKAAKETIIKGSGYNRPVFLIGPSNKQVTLKGLQINNGRDVGLKVTGNSSLAVKNCRIIKNDSHGISGVDYSKTKIENSIISENGWSGLRLHDSATANVENSEFSLNDWSAIDLSESSGIVIINSEIVNNMDGINLWNSSWASITGSRLSHNHFGISPNHESVVDIEENTIIDNYYSVAPKRTHSDESEFEKEFGGKIMGDSNNISKNGNPLYPKKLKFLRTNLGGEFGSRPIIPTSFDSK